MQQIQEFNLTFRVAWIKGDVGERLDLSNSRCSGAWSWWVLSPLFQSPGSFSNPLRFPLISSSALNTRAGPSSSPVNAHYRYNETSALLSSWVLATIPLGLFSGGISWDKTSYV